MRRARPHYTPARDQGAPISSERGRVSPLRVAEGREDRGRECPFAQPCLSLVHSELLDYLPQSVWPRLRDDVGSNVQIVGYLICDSDRTALMLVNLVRVSEGANTASIHGPPPRYLKRIGNKNDHMPNTNFTEDI